MKIVVLFSFLCFSLSTLVSQAQNLNNAYSAMEAGDWEVALRVLEPIIKKSPTNDEAKFLAAICYTERYRLDEALALFQQSTSMAQGLPYFWVKFAKAYLLNEQIDDAERTIRRVRMQDLESYLRPDYLLVSENIKNAKIYLASPLDIIIKNLGSNINTDGNEYSQVVTRDQRGIYFTARRKGASEVADDGEAYEQVLRAEMNDIDGWDSDSPLEGFASATANEAPIQLFNNDSTLIIFYDEDLFISEKQKDGSWSSRKPLPINSKRWESHAFIYNNGNSMIFASDINNEVENLDLFMIEKDTNGKWGKPKAIKELNTPLNDDAPFVAEDGTLYFSSRGHNSMGGYDIFKTKYDSAAGQFIKPESMGAPINLPNDDTFFSMYGGFAYLSSNRPEGYGQVDIYRIIMFNKSLIQGKFLDCDGVTPIANAKITAEIEGGQISTTTTNEFGVYKIVMPIERSFSLRAELNGETIYEKKHTIRVLFRDQFDIEQDFYVGCDKNEEIFYIDLINSFDLEPDNLSVEPPSTEGIIPKEEIVVEPEVMEIVASSPAKIEIKLPIVFFDFNKQNIKSKFFQRLDEAAKLLVNNREFRVIVSGHTDEYGTNEYNVALGIRRYTEVINYLISKGVNPSQLETKTFSEDIPMASNFTIAGRAFNRRVELSFIEK